jgi:DNA mismatch endonuclease (patch repair protein)
MKVQRRADTNPELRLRKRLHAKGLRYRVGVKVPGNRRRTIDIAFTKARVAIFVDGCFWHACPVHSVPVKNNSTWWAQKLQSNVTRDRSTDEMLRAQGWEVVRIWEHEDTLSAADLVEKTVKSRRGA